MQTRPLTTWVRRRIGRQTLCRSREAASPSGTGGRDLPLSVTIIARDEADRIAEAIASVAFADEVLVLDSGSSDDTAAVARSMGARVEETARPCGAEEPSGRACLSRMDPEHRRRRAGERRTMASIQAVLAAGPLAAGFEVRLSTYWEPNCVMAWYPDQRVRLFDRGPLGWPHPHDTVEVNGPIARLGGDLLHVPYRNLGEHLRTIDRYTAISAGLRRRCPAAGGTCFSGQFYISSKRIY